MFSGNGGDDNFAGGNGNDRLLGKSGADRLVGGQGGDRLTGGTGADTFILTTLKDSLLSGFDRITDFTIGADRIDAPKAIVLGQVVQQGVVSQLNATKIAAVLTASTFTANGAATFTIGNGRRQQTFLALNNGIAGFSVKTDAIINITGYIGNLADLTIG